MGLADRDYMRERERERAESRGAVYSPRRGDKRWKHTTVLKMLGLALAMGAAGFLYSASRRPEPALMGPIRVTSTTETQSTQTPSNGMAMNMAFPESGTVEWGMEGQPIGGSLERLEIWDVTQSVQNKVVRIRSAPETIFATVYVKAGQRASLIVPANRRYKVTASAGDMWRGVPGFFGPGGTTVDFGMVDILPGAPGVIAMGAPDQTASIVPNDRF